VHLAAKVTLVPSEIVRALGTDPRAGKAIFDAMEDIVAAAAEVMRAVGDPEAYEVANQIVPRGKKGPILPFTAQIVPGDIPVGLVASNHPASKRWEYGSTASRQQIFNRPKASAGRGKKGARPRLPTPAVGFMRTGLVRAGTRTGRRTVGT